jgi:hypothetical protein
MDGAADLEILVRSRYPLILVETLEEARRALRRAMLTDGRLDPNDFDRLLASKREALGRDGLLEYYAPSDTREPVAGLTGLKASVTMSERVKALREWARGRAVPAS